MRIGASYQGGCDVFELFVPSNELKSVQAEVVCKLVCKQAELV